MHMASLQVVQCLLSWPKDTHFRCRILHHHHHHHVQEGLGLIPVPCILKMKLVPPSLPWSSYVSLSFWFILQCLFRYPVCVHPLYVLQPLFLVLFYFLYYIPYPTKVAVLWASINGSLQTHTSNPLQAVLYKGIHTHLCKLLYTCIGGHFIV